MKHDPLCNNANGPCCPWMGECECQCNCDFIAEVRRDDRQRVAEGEVVEDYMCPFCATPWKCNGPHIEEDDLEEFESYVEHRIKEALDVEETPHGSSQWHAGYQVGYREGKRNGVL